MYHASKSKSQQWGPWSEWGWDEQEGRYYRVRQDSKGNLEYEYESADQVAAASTPRDPGINVLTEGFPDLSINYEDPIPEEHSSKSKSSKSKSKKNTRSSSHDEDAGQNAYSPSAAESIQESEAGQYNYTSQYYPKTSTSSYYQTQAIGGVHTQTTSHLPDREPIDKYSSEHIMSVTNDQITGYNHNAEFADSIATSSQYNSNAYATEGGHSVFTYAPYDDEEDEGPPTPKAQSDHGDHISSALDEHLQLDPRYQVEPSIKFQPGEIFKVHWSEPKGSTNDGSSNVSGKEEISKFGTKFFVGFRRFVVVANDQGHCACVPILTYGGKGCKKKGVKAEKHGIIHEKNHRPKTLDKEPKLGFPPVRVEMREDGEKLSKESRINYSKLVTVEHNVRVFFIGSVVSDDFQKVGDAVNTCWQKKSHHKQRHR